ncbi:MAG: hypothetical protein ACRDQU_11610 [Pseudonocardiaceae bacterium]
MIDLDQFTGTAVDGQVEDADAFSGSRLRVIKQWGPRRLWDEVELAYQWWVSEGRPSHDRFGMSVGPDSQSVWLDDPSRPVLMG